MQIDRYRWLILPGQRRMARVVVEHSAIAAHDPKAAVEVIKLHLGKLVDEISTFSEHIPDYFLRDE